MSQLNIHLTVASQFRGSFWEVPVKRPHDHGVSCLRCRPRELLGVFWEEVLVLVLPSVKRPLDRVSVEGVFGRRRLLPESERLPVGSPPPEE